MSITVKEIIIDEIRSAIGYDEHSGVTCELCGFTHSVRRLQVRTGEGSCSFNACEGCVANVENMSKFGERGLVILNREVLNA